MTTWKQTKESRPWPHREFEWLKDKRYPIGWGTGLTAEEWREFADEYVPLTSEENKRLMG